MPPNKIQYSKFKHPVHGMKYRLKHHYRLRVPYADGLFNDDSWASLFSNRYVELFVNRDSPGHFHSDLFIGRGYQWDGTSGPTVDTKNTLRASLVHDALYQLMRMGAIPPSYRPIADRLFRRILEEDGVNYLRRWRFYLAVRIFGAKAARKRKDK